MINHEDIEKLSVIVDNLSIAINNIKKRLDLVDPNEAPEGYVAKLQTNKNVCEGCALKGKDECAVAICGKYRRKDGKSVYFVRKG